MTALTIVLAIIVFIDNVVLIGVGLTVFRFFRPSKSNSALPIFSTPSLTDFFPVPEE